MSHQLIFKCDVCEKQKAETNHWLLTESSFNDSDDEIAIQFKPWNDHEARANPFTRGHICSQGCATTRFQHFLEANAQTNVFNPEPIQAAS